MRKPDRFERAVVKAQESVRPDNDEHWIEQAALAGLAVKLLRREFAALRRLVMKKRGAIWQSQSGGRTVLGEGKLQACDEIIDAMEKWRRGTR